jgi:rRNA maturation endonuclease Nob1
VNDYENEKVKRMDIRIWRNKISFFYKKVCKICGTKMKKVTTEEYTGIEKWIDPDGIKFNTENYKVRYYYHCEKCNKTFSLEELSNKK